eukprot:CAMPEP_0178402232 /NCGR_PEP_ID=MMETSP0689_2-20121128/16727_1 /TAXON_ID=160604 /ORGANISM="Amphidinium massartii, Strain CS-259" /LENGTH=276 /DNA_ID=CAMNT_0020023109 /DNA_START=61 /DNA_END=891 /DNA_ORIENTATION=-
MTGFLTTPPIMGHLESYFPPDRTAAQTGQLLAGPSIMITTVILQYIYKFMSGKHENKTYQHVWKFISKAEARDKVGRIVQYGCRALQGILAHMSPTSPWQSIKPLAAEVQTTLAWARRTHRWMKELPHIPALGEAIDSGDILEACQRVTIITFLVQDHIYWLLKVGILKFEKYSAIQWHRRNLRFVTLSHVWNFILCWRAVRRIQEKQANKDPKYSGSPEALRKAEADIYDQRRMMLRYTLTFFQMLHVSQVKKLDDWYVGIMGMISSYIDASKQW